MAAAAVALVVPHPPPLAARASGGDVTSARLAAARSVLEAVRATDPARTARAAEDVRVLTAAAALRMGAPTFAFAPAITQLHADAMVRPRAPAHGAATRLPAAMAHSAAAALASTDLPLGAASGPPHIALSVPLPHVEPLVASAPAAARLAAVAAAEVPDSVNIEAYVHRPSWRQVREIVSRETAARACEKRLRRHDDVITRLLSLSPSLTQPRRAPAGTAPGDAVDHRGDVVTAVSSPVAPPDSGSMALEPPVRRYRCDGAATAGGSAPADAALHQPPRVYSDVDVRRFRAHCDAYGELTAARLRRAGPGPGRGEATASGGDDGDGAPFSATAGEPPLAPHASAALSPHVADRRAAALVRVGGRDPRLRPYFHQTTNELLASLEAFRAGLQQLERDRRAHNRVLLRDPADVEHLTWERSLPMGYDAPYPMR